MLVTNTTGKLLIQGAKFHHLYENGIKYILDFGPPNAARMILGNVEDYTTPLHQT